MGSLVLEAVGAAAQADAEEDDQHQDEHHNDDDEPHLLVLPPHLPSERHPSSAHVALVFCTTSRHLCPEGLALQVLKDKMCNRHSR